MSEWRLIPSLLIIEDSDEDFEVTLRALRKIASAIRISRCTDGDDALDWLYQRGAHAQRPVSDRPHLILLDLNLPATDGREVLLTIKHDEGLRSIPVAVLTTSSNPKDIESCYRAGANSYLIKPVDTLGFVRMMQLLCDYWFSAVALPDQGR